MGRASNRKWREGRERSREIAKTRLPGQQAEALRLRQLFSRPKARS
jgi:hypothetical protein